MDRRHRVAPLVAIVAACAALLLVAGCTGGSSVSAGSPSPSGSAAGSPTSGSLTYGGIARSYRLHAPAAPAGSGPVPLLVALHGGGGTGAHFEQISGFDQLADSDGFIVAYPDAVRPPGGQVASWNAGLCCGWAAQTGVDDVGFIHALIDALSADDRIDPQRIYVTGFSNGGMLAYRIACQLAGTVAAVGVQSATLEYAPCQPSAPVSLLHIHGDADTNIPLAGGHGTGLSNADFNPPPQSAATIASADGCDTTPTTTPDPTLPDAQLSTWAHCPVGVDVHYVTVTDLAHTWLGTSAAQIWTFLAAHPRPVP